MQDYLKTALSTTKETRQFLTSDDFYEWIFSQGTKQADKWYQQILPVAQLAGYKTIYKEQYFIRRAAVVREEFGLNQRKMLEVIAFDDYGKFKLPVAYDMDDVNGLLKFDETACTWEVVFPHPIIVAKRYKNIINGEHSVKIVFFDDGRITEFICPLYHISNAQQIQALTKNGVRVSSVNAQVLVHFLTEFITVNKDVLLLAHSTSILGWTKDNGFLPYCDEVEFDGNSYTKQVLNAIKPTGDYEKWKKIAIESMKNDYVRVCMAASFASPLLHFTKKPIFMVHLWGASGTAKTVALYLALSAWGQPQDICCQWNATVVAAEQKAIILNNIPMSMNESELLHGTKSAFQSHSDFVYMYCEGESKPRGAKDGGLQIGGRWHSCCISNGEGAITSDKSKEGEMNRILEFNTDEKLFGTPERAIEVANFIKENYGHAGREFTETCFNYPLIDLWNEFFSCAKSDGTEKQAGEMASLLLGDMIMQVVVFKREQTAAKNNTFALYDRIKTSMKTVQDVNLSVRALDFVRGWIAQNYGNFIQAGQYDPQQIYGMIEHGRIYVINTILADALERQGYNLAKTHKYFRENNIFTEMGKDAVTVRKRIKGSIPRCYVFYDNAPTSQDE